MLQVKSIDIRLFNMQTRIPFRYGISTLLACPHLFLKLTVEVDGKIASGVSADHLPPKWFTKNPDSPFASDVDDMLAVIRHAADHSILAGAAATVYDLISRVYFEQKIWAKEKGYPPLLASFGTSLVERAIIEAVCRAKGINFSTAVRKNVLGVRFSGFADEHLMLDYQELGDTRPGGWLPAEPLQQTFARHTVGMVDYLTDAEIPAGERVNDGLPQSLESAIQYYGLTHFKLKAAGDVAKDLDRLGRIFALIRKHVRGEWAFTLDFNENFKQIGPFRELWEKLSADPLIKEQLTHLVFIEQPLHRDVALSAEVGKGLHAWADRPPIIIDESDGYAGAVLDALALGYAGTSHKNCKGIIKSIAAACIIAKRGQENPEKKFVISAEDLCNVGPVALLQDLAVAAALGIENVERNGHHYFKGLSMHSKKVQEQIMRHHGDLYRWQGGESVTGGSGERYPTMAVKGGRIDVGSVVAAPFGVGFELDVEEFTRLGDWKFEGVELRG